MAKLSKQFAGLLSPSTTPSPASPAPAAAGDPDRRQIIGTARIANVTPGALEREDGTALYRAVVDGRPIGGQRIRHRRADGAWVLLAHVLRRTGAGR